MGFRQSALDPPGKKGALLAQGHSGQQPGREENALLNSLPLFHQDVHGLRAWGCPLESICKAPEIRFPGFRGNLVPIQMYHM